jgi:cellulose synthase/poly-beta-1,6-N-acetylglucosamine synthase-like glycosyltransferase
MLPDENETSATSKVSIIVPVLRWSRTLEDTLQKLIADPFPDKEVIVAIDEPTPHSLELAQRYGRTVRFSFCDRRRGKVGAIEDCFASSSGSILIFLDADIVIRTSDIVTKTASEIKGYDMLEMKKGIVSEGFLSNIVYYEYVGFNSANWMMAKRMKRTLGILGTGFAITREAYERIGGFRAVVSEDMDLALRAYLHDLSFKYDEDIWVDTFAPSTLKGWWTQRKRWSYGVALWFHDNYRPLLSALKKHPGILGMALMMIFPAFLGALFGLSLKNVATLDIVLLAMLSLSTRLFPMLLPALIPFSALPDFFSLGLALLVGLAAYSSIYLAFAWKLGYRFRPLYFTLYYLIYSPAWLVAVIWGLLTVFVRRETIEVDWKV